MLRGVILKPHKTNRTSPKHTFFMEEKEIYLWKKLLREEKVAKVTTISAFKVIYPNGNILKTSKNGSILKTSKTDIF